MTPQELTEKINNSVGRELYKLTSWAFKNNKKEFLNLCYQRAKLLNAHFVGDWEKAKEQFDVMIFPTVKLDNKYFYQTTRVLGYLCEFKQEMTDTMQIKNQSMVLYNHQTNSCVVKQLIANKGVMFQ